MGYLDGFLVTLRQHRFLGGDRVTTSYSGGRVFKKKKSVAGRDEKIEKPERLHGRHVLNRYEDGMEKCIGCELRSEGFLIFEPVKSHQRTLPAFQAFSSVS